MANNIGFIGAGNMATSLIGGMIAQGYQTQSIRACEPDNEQCERVASSGIEIMPDNNSLADWSDMLILAVKPQVIRDVSHEISSIIRHKQPLLISIAAGIRIDSIQQWLNADCAIVRVMPNTPALVGQGMSALYANELVSEEQRQTAQSILASVGDTLWLDNEDDLDAVTEISGSGPATMRPAGSRTAGLLTI